MLTIANREKIDKYFQSDALSQSVLKKMLGGYESFISNKEEEKELYYKEKGHFIIGSAVDCMLTDTEESFNEQYYIAPTLTNKLSDTEMSIVKSIFDKATEVFDIKELKSLSEQTSFIILAINEHEWQPKWKLDTKVNKIIENGTEYFEQLKLSYGKQLLSLNEINLINSIVLSLQTSPNTKKYFDRLELKENQNLDVYYQYPIYFLYKGVQCKALLDMLIIKKSDDKLILYPIDFKTMNGYTINFPNSIKTFRYDIQAAWYTEALNQHFKDQNHEIRYFEFIVESTTNPGTPLVYQITNQLLTIGKEGRKDILVSDLIQLFQDNEVYQPYIVVPKIKGFDELIDEYIYYCENEWRSNKIIEENNGVLQVGWNGII